jgi:hypothetical protein
MNEDGAEISEFGKIVNIVRLGHMTAQKHHDSTNGIVLSRGIRVLSIF